MKAIDCRDNKIIDNQPDFCIIVPGFILGVFVYEDSGIDLTLDTRLGKLDNQILLFRVKFDPGWEDIVLNFIEACVVYIGQDLNIDKINDIMVNYIQSRLDELIVKEIIE